MTEFDDETSVDEYMNALNSPEVQKILEAEGEAEKKIENTNSLEQVIESPIRNKKKGALPENKVPITSSTTSSQEIEAPPTPVQPASQAPVQQPPELQPVQLVQPTSQTIPQNHLSASPQPQPKPEPTEEPLISIPSQPQPKPKFVIDDWIEQTGDAIGFNAAKEFKDNARNNLIAVITGQAVIVPAQQLQQQQQPPQPEPAPKPQPKPEPVVEVPVPKVNTESQLKQRRLEQLAKLDEAIANPALKGNWSALKKARCKLQCELDGLPFDESTYVESPVDPKVVKQKKPPKRWSKKVSIALIVLVAVIGAAIVLLIPALMH